MAYITLVALAAVIGTASAAPMLYHYKAPTLAPVVEVDVTSRELPIIPQSFLGLSHEWPYVEDMANQDGYMQTLKWLSSFGGGPMVIRVGGGSSDLQTFVPEQRVWDSLKRLHEGTGAKYILGLNLESLDSNLTLAQMQAAQKTLPASSIMTFEIGNEPNFYKDMYGNYSGEAYIACCFHEDWKRTAQNLSCPLGQGNCTPGQFAGPAWGHVNVRNTTIDWFLTVNSQYVGMVTLHWYKATKEAYNTAVSLLEEAPIRKEIGNLKELVKTAASYGKPLRVAEMNTISNSGRDGVSNVFAAALWTINGCFEVASTGATGVNLHQGAGQNLYSAFIRTYHPDNVRLRPVLLRPPFYALALFQQAVRGKSQMLPSTFVSGQGQGLKVWPLWGIPERQLRVVLINTRPSDAMNATLLVDQPGGWGGASITRLVANSSVPLEALSGVTLGGISYGLGGVPQGVPVVEKALRTKSADGKLAWSIYMPHGSAALVTIQRFY